VDEIAGPKSLEDNDGVAVLPRALTARPDAAVVPAAPSTSAIVRNVGRFAVVCLPSLVAVAVSGSLLSEQGLVATLLVSTIWFAAIVWSIDAHAKELLALGVFPATVRGAVFGVIGVSAADYWVNWVKLTPVALASSALAVLVLSSAWEAFVGNHLETRRRVLIVGTGRATRELLRDLALAPPLPFELIGLVDDESGGHSLPPAPILGVVAQLPEIVAHWRPDLVVVAVERDRPTAFRYILDSASSGFKVLELPQFYEHALGRVPVRDLSRA
jgi:FlaA1/EpsC-like NDP-sugar epimerase